MNAERAQCSMSMLTADLLLRTINNAIGDSGGRVES